ncbi:MAG: hypothetical protein CSA66_05470 [Proteobacteria bacterium]|nr:MAG: hypothetical protein CSA66_05470 [Pseudomonadota bacterium]
MSGRALQILAGLAMATVFHGALALAYSYYAKGRVSLSHAMYTSEQALQAQRLNLCDKRRCPRVEGRRLRRRPEEPKLVEPEILEAAMVPALGGVVPDPTRLPEIEAYEQPDRVEEAINLEEQRSELGKVIKAKQKEEAKRDPLSKESELSQLLDEYDNDDPRARRKSIDRITGFKGGEIGGSGLERRLGNIYSRKAARAMSAVFKVPPFIDKARLHKLKVKVRVTKLGFDGAIEAYSVLSKSGDRSFDDAAIATIKRFSRREGGSKRLPTPDAEVLRYINARGLVVTLDGRLMRR